MPITNKHNIPLSLAVAIAFDEYAHSDNPDQISVTTLIKPVKQIIMSRRAKAGATTTSGDLSGNIASFYGNAIHGFIEKAWCSTQVKRILKSLGYPKPVRERLLVNPEPSEITEDSICVYTEKRTNKKVGKWTVSGEFDFCAEGMVRDFKSTGTYTYIHKTNDDKYILQGSLYRWLNPEIITDDRMCIDFIFTDWSALSAKTKSNYPATRVLEYPLILKPVDVTDTYVKDKLIQLEQLENADEKDIPPCTKEDLWAGDYVYKYYKDPNSMKRSTKNFTNYHEAEQRRLRDGSCGVILTVRPEVKACRFCDGLSECKQALQYINDGTLKLE